ncbi:MAG: GLUG motif-containing protein, partial [Cloacibacillus sp.]
MANCVVQSCDISQTSEVDPRDNMVGGVAGFVEGSTVKNSVADCLVTSKGSAGGIVGLAAYYSSILNCYSSGTLVAAQTTARLGGIAGKGLDVTIENCISSAVLSGDAAVKGGIIGDS